MRGRAPGALLLLPLAQPAPHQCRWSELTLALLPQGQGASLKAALIADKTWEVNMYKGYILSPISCFSGASDPLPVSREHFICLWEDNCQLRGLLTCLLIGGQLRDPKGAPA